MADNRDGNEHISYLEEARQKVIDQRRQTAKVMAAGSVKENAEVFTALQKALVAIEGAIKHEQDLAPRDPRIGRQLPRGVGAPV